MGGPKGGVDKHDRASDHSCTTGIFMGQVTASGKGADNSIVAARRERYESRARLSRRAGRAPFASSVTRFFDRRRESSAE